eukprot:CAMPEP_0168463150 /NCGR_PEP_ID=MMETSP0228-20121227/54902_1 /TAXON_ID=133427 /ORGANISM="Protoceratium reticulatum, Strain CCCM 535 (=CCMP 1889)" /LENGTH=191 /DNA_ID=CAMNT_0008478587 /DNA_START=47 /DNA_END=619 /DNA_ORIENTATION=+
MERHVHWQEGEEPHMMQMPISEAPGQVFRTPAHHLWSTPGHRADTEAPPLSVVYDADMGDLVVQLPEPVTETILRCELPHICDLRPHEDPRVEAWLLRWVDGEGGDGPLIVQALTLATLQVLTSEQPEVCPLFCTQLGRFEKALDRWLLDWPAAEPWRAALPASARGGPTAEVLELELHAALALLRAGPPA